VSQARTKAISGPVLRARPEGPFVLREAVHVGEAGLLGEVIRVAEDEIVVQVYEDTTGLRPGTVVTGTGRPLSVRLGPGILGEILDGLLRPICGKAEPYVKPGMQAAEPQVFPFEPLVRIGDRVGAGHAYGSVDPPDAIAQKVITSPGMGGEVIRIAEPGNYRDDETVMELRGDNGEKFEVAMSHVWPVRTPRPVTQRLPSDEPFITGQRVIDCIFPVALGGKASIPGGFGTGKTVLLETLAKWCSADVIIYVGCGERGNEMAGLLDDFSQLHDPRSGRLLIERTVVIANTSNMPVAAREASIYTAVTVAEYYRDQGLNVALMADSTSRWAEALREVSGRLGEIPGESGYPAYLSSRLAEFYERAARAKTLGGGIGSVTIMGAVSPPSGDFSEPVTSHTRRYIHALWALDTHRAQARFYPAIHPLQSYSEDAVGLARYWQARGCVRWSELRRGFLELLEEQARLERMARIIGKDALPPRQRLTLLCAELVNEAFLRQSAFSENDRFASPRRQATMMRLLGDFIDLATQAVDRGIEPEALTGLPVYRRLQRMGEEIPEQDMDAYSALGKQLADGLRQLTDEIPPQADAQPQEA